VASNLSVKLPLAGEISIKHSTNIIYVKLGTMKKDLKRDVNSLA
jgi:hypothetical protein